jgi:hypothetical protein
MIVAVILTTLLLILVAGFIITGVIDSFKDSRQFDNPHVKPTKFSLLRARRERRRKALADVRYSQSMSAAVQFDDTEANREKAEKLRREAQGA